MSRRVQTITTAEGLTIRRLRSSNGAQLANGDQVGVFYAGRLTDGTPFDANFNFKGFQPLRDLFVFNLGAGQVIPGWDLGLQGRRLGEVLELTIPSNLAYGSAGNATIPANSTLVFRVMLVGRLAPGRSETDFFSLSDLGIDNAKLGLTTRMLRRIENPVVGTDVGDVIIGTPRRDLLIGLHGPDRFAFQSLGDAAGVGRNRDLIADFAGKRGDRLDLRRIDADTTRAGNQPFRFVGKRAFSGTAGELRYRGGVLRGDVNGNGIADLEIGLLGAPALRPDHIWL
jgi:hypothetical protein